MSQSQMYAVPISPYAVNDADLDRLRQQLTVAESAAERATDWTTRTRAEQNAKIIRRELQSAETERRLEQARQNMNRAPGPDQHAVNLAHAVREGRYVAPVPYFEQPTVATTHPADEVLAANAAAHAADWRALSWAQLNELVPLMVAEARRVGAVR